MFLGHYAAALAAKRAAPGPSLGWLIAAAQWPDLVWPILLLAGVERVRIDPGNTALTPLDFEHYPWTHSLLAVVLWGAALGFVYHARRRDRAGALAVGLLVVSHWVLDWVTHRPDLPIVPGGARYGLGLWNSVAATVVVELVLFAVALALYLRATRAVDRTGRWALWGLVAFLLLVSVANVFSPPPPSISAVAWGSLAGWLFPFWGAWIDRHRAVAVAA
jgi:hypothetical protein